LIGRRRHRFGQRERIILAKDGGGGIKEQSAEKKERTPDCVRYGSENPGRANGWERNSRSCCRR
jgi:hypothetical protein